MTFDIDANGILKVSAVEKGTGKEQTITVSGSSNLNKDEVDRMVKEAAANAETDRKARESAERHNKADQLIYQTEGTIKDLGDKLDSTERESIQAKIDAVKATADGDDEAAFNEAHTALQTAAFAMSQKLYEAQAAETPAEGAPATEETPAPAEDDVIDADFKAEEK